PADELGWKWAVYRRGGYGRLLRFYVMNTARAWGIMSGSMQEYSRDIRHPVLANFSRQDGFPRGARSHADPYSRLKSRVFREYGRWLPAVVFLAVGIVAAVWLRSRAALTAWALLIGLAAIVEMLVATLTDALETSRHLLLFH